MTDKKITELTAATLLASTDLIPVVTNPGTTPETKKITLANFANSLSSWADFTTPNYSFIDDGAGGQPTTQKARYSAVGKTMHVFIHASGTKVTSNNVIAFTTTLTAPAQGAVKTQVGSGFVTTSGDLIGIVLYSGGTYYFVCQSSITDNTVISDFSVFLTYEI